MRPQHLLNYGYTPTHQAIVAALAAALRPSGEGVIRLLDPCAGTGAALAALAEALRAQGARVETYGVEIEAARAGEAARVLDHVIRDDWRKISMSERSISLALLNPPYDHAGGEASLEREIVRLAMEKVAPEGVAILVIPRRLLEWARRFHMEWLALRTSPDPASPSQVVLVGIRRPGIGPQPLPPERPLEEGFPEIPVPALRTPPPAFHKIMLEEEDMAEALAEGPEPLDLLTEASREEFHPLHPLRPGHRAMVLAAHRRTLHLPELDLRVTLRQVMTERVEQDEQGRRIRRVLIRPVLAVWVLDGRGLREEPFDRLADHAAAIDRLLRIRARVEEDERGWPRTEAWEAEVLEAIGRRLPPMGGRQGLLPAQATRAVGMARALLAGERAVFGVMEMGYGKTPISLTVRALVGARKRVGLTVIMCPPHLVPKWEREARRLFPDARVVVPEGNGEERIRAVREAVEAARGGREVFLILSREAAKLGPLHRVGVIPRLIPGYGWRWACPHCFAPAAPGSSPRAVLDEAFPAPPPPALRDRLECRAAGWQEELERLEIERERLQLLMERARGTDSRPLQGWIRNLERRIRQIRIRLRMVGPADPEPPGRLLGRSCPACGRPYATPTASPRRWPLADVLSREARRAGLDLFLIADEVHEYRHASLQGSAFSRLLRAARWAVLLTGTLFGGKASELYRLLRWTSPELRRLGIGPEEFASAFGHLERVEVLDETERRRYGRSVSRERLTERPGISPGVFRFLLNRTAFGSLQDVAASLPPYREGREILEPDFPLPEGLRENAAGPIFREHGMGGLTAWLQAALGYLNAAPARPADGEPDHVYDYVRSDPDGRAWARVEVLRLPVTPGDPPLAKERRLAEIVRAEREAGRKVVVLVQQTGRRPVADRLVAVLRKAGLRAEALDPARVPPAEREEWILRKAPSLDALVVHPKAVETGLDLVMFQTAVVYEVVYSAVTLIQAIRRLWRLGQTRPVRVIVLAHRGTLEVPAWDLIARKISWAMTAYGDFVASALGAVEDPSLDILQALARRLTEASGSPPAAPEGAGEGEEMTLAGIRIGRAPTGAPEARAGPPETPAPPRADLALAGLPLFRAAIARPEPPPRKEGGAPEDGEIDLSRLRQGTLF